MFRLSCKTESASLSIHTFDTSEFEPGTTLFTLGHGNVPTVRVGDVPNDT